MGSCASEFTIERPINEKNSDSKRCDSCYDVKLPYMEPLAAKSTAVFFSAFEMYMYKSMIYR